MKRKYLRPNQARFTTKNLDKAIMKLSRPRNTFCAIGNVSEIMQKTTKPLRKLFENPKKQHFVNPHVR